jgi:hypothetical protein
MTVSDVTWTGKSNFLTVTDKGEIELQKDPYTDQYYELGYYYFEDSIDFGQIYPTHINAQVEAYGFRVDSDGVEKLDTRFDAWIEVRCATTAIVLDDWPILDQVVPNLDAWSTDWQEWRKFYAGEYTGRFFEFRLAIATYRQGVSARVKKASIEVTSAIRIDGQDNLICPVGGMRIVYNPAFQSTPSIGITQDNSAEGDTYKITNKDRNGFDIEFFNNGVSVSHQFDWIARGYGSETRKVPNNRGFNL